MTQHEPAVKLRDISFRYGRNLVLDGVTLDIRHDDFIAIIGPNGGGKTTLLKIILGLIEPAAGTVRVFGEPPSRTRHRIGYIPQHAQFDADFPITVEQVVLMGRLGHTKVGRRYTAQDREAAHRAMAALELEPLAKRELSALSGGERQRTLAARALASEPDMLAMDEPTASVDSRVEQSFYDMLRELHARMPIVLVSHDLGFVSAYVNRVACLNQRLVVSAVEEVRAHDLEAMYGAPVKMWSHACEL